MRRRRGAALRALLRVELRQLRRHPRRSLLLAALVAVPVAAIVGGSSLQRVLVPSTAERQARAVGRADLMVAPASPDDGWTELLPDDAPVVELRGPQPSWVEAPGLRLLAHALALPAEGLAEDGLARGMFELDRGRAPAHVDEVCLSPGLLRGLRCELGDEVQVDGSHCRIVGEVVDPAQLDRPLALRLLETLPRRAAGVFLVGGIPEAPALAARLEEAGHRILADREVGAPDGLEQFFVFVLGSIGLFEAALVIGAAFAIGLRRRQREIGLLASIGAPIRGMRRALLGSAACLALVGGVLGVVLGLGAAAALHPSLDEWTARRNGPLEVVPLSVLGAVALGVISALAAAVLPTFSATRLPVRVALSGRRPVQGGGGRWLRAGLAMVAVGIGVVALGTRTEDRTTGLCFVAGSILGVLGFGLCSPFVLARLAAVAAPLPPAWRLAARDAGRFRSRYGPVVTAVLAGMSISVTIATLLASFDTLIGARRPVLPETWLWIDGPGAEPVAAELHDELGARSRCRLQAACVEGRPITVEFLVEGNERPGRGWIALGDDELCRTALGEEALPAFRAGRLLALRAALEPASIRFHGPGAEALDGVPTEVHDGLPSARGPALIGSAAALADRGVAAGAISAEDLQPWALRLDRAVDDDVLEHARRRAARLPGTTVDANLLHARESDRVYQVVLLVCFLTGWLVLIVATSLSSAESASDLRTLHSLGAPPALLRRHVAARSAYLAFLGCVLSIPAGMIPAVGLISLARVPLSLQIPWTEIGVTVLALPVVAYAGAWSVSLLRQLVKARRAALSPAPLPAS